MAWHGMGIGFGRSDNLLTFWPALKHTFSPLLNGRDALLLFHSLLDPLNSVRWLNVDLDLLSRQSLDLDL